MAESKTEEIGIVPIHSIDRTIHFIDRKREPTNERDEGEGGDSQKDFDEADVFGYASWR